MGFEVNNPFLYQLREGSLADPFVDKVESLRVVDGRLLLSEMPVKQNGVVIDGHTEIDTNTPTGTQFYVDYTNGTVYFISTKNATVTARYKGRGLVQVPSERVYHKKGSVTRTLDVIVETVDTSAQSALNAASYANQKAGEAVAAKETVLAQNANSKKYGDFAKEQGDFAKVQGDYAKSTADSVVNQLNANSSAAETARKAATDADNARAGVLNSVSVITNQGTLAAQSAAQATSQAEYAKTQGDYAKAQGDAAKAAVVGTIANKAVTSAKLDDDVQVGSLKTLKTDVKTSVTGALNEIFEDVTKTVLGGKLMSSSKANFLGKNSGSTLENPHTSKLWATVGDLNTPFSSWSEFVNSQYSRISTLDSIVEDTSNGVNEAQVQQIFSFNLIEQVQRQYGIILGGSTSEKVDWLRNNLSRFIFNWWGFGSSPTGSKATVCAWRNDLNTWYARISSVVPYSDQISCVLGSKDDVHVAIDNNGFVHFLAYAEKSDGTIPSIISTDYAELIVDLQSDILSNLSNVSSHKSGLMSPIDKKTLDESQKWKLTDFDGKGIMPLAGTNFNEITKTGLYRYSTDLGHTGQPEGLNYWNVEVMDYDSNNVTQRWSSILSKDVVYTRRRLLSGWQQFKRIINSDHVVSTIMGNKFVDKSIANFVGKAAGSEIANPHRSNGISGYTSLIPANTVLSETSQLGYDLISSLNGSLAIASNSGSGQISQWIFSFNLIDHIQRNYGSIPGFTTSEKSFWLKNNLSKLTLNWWGFGSSPTGNNATIVCFSDQWDGALRSHNASSVTGLSSPIPSEAMHYYVQSNGFVHFLAYAGASDGTTPSVISTDYVELNIELSTDIWSSAKPQWVNATLQNSWVEFDATQTPKYELGKDGFVELIGAVKLGTLGSVMMTLPAGYRPIKQFTGLLSGNDGSIYRIVISTAGIVTVTQSVGSGGNAFVSLDGIRFPVV